MTYPSSDLYPEYPPTPHPFPARVIANTNNNALVRSGGSVCVVSSCVMWRVGVCGGGGRGQVRITSTHSPCHSPAHPLTHVFIGPLAHSPTYSRTHALTLSHSHPFARLTRTLAPPPPPPPPPPHSLSTAKVRAFDTGGLSAVAEIVVLAENVNDNAPVLTGTGNYSCELVEKGVAVEVRHQSLCAVSVSVCCDCVLCL